MIDRSVSIGFGRLAAIILALVGGVLCIANTFMPNDKLGALSVPFVCSAAVLEIRTYMCRLDARDRNAYELGRDSVRSIR